MPSAPVPACECLSDLTRYLCVLGRSEEARREVDAFAEQYPQGSFLDYEFYDHRYARNVRIAVTKREQATLRRIERGLGSAGGRVTRFQNFHKKPQGIVAFHPSVTRAWLSLTPSGGFRRPAGSSETPAHLATAGTSPTGFEPVFWP